MSQLQSPGFGIGLRPQHYDDIVSQKPAVDWFEIISEDFLLDGGSPLYYLDQIRKDYPIAMHGVSLSIGGTHPLDQDYLHRLKALIDRVQPLWVSDHFCWTGTDGVNLHDLLPLPYNETSIDHLVHRIAKVQEFLGQHILLENVSSYVNFKESDMTEWEFISEVARRADCLLLLDINNIYVNAFNHNFSAESFIDHIPVEKVRQFHIAGHENCRTHIIDSHDNAISAAVWDLYAQAVQRFGDVALLVERDGNVPPLDELLMEMQHAKNIYQQQMCLQ